MRAAPRLAAWAAAAVIGLALSAGSATAQERVCNIAESGDIEQREVGVRVIIEFRDPFFVRCTDGTELRALEGTLNQTERRLELRGDVDFRDPFRTLTADRATYESQSGRLHATGNVVFVDIEEGSEIRGPELEYFRPIEGRPEPEVHATGRPHLTLEPRDREGDGAEPSTDAEPLEIDADRLTILGRDDLTAQGSVVITRTDLVATAASARYAGSTGDLTLLGDAAIESGEYDLTGDRIDALLVDDALERVDATGDAALASADLDVASPSIRMFFADDLLQRAVARGADGQPRPVARSETFRLEADSIDAIVPGQRIERVVAVGSARGESIDTTAAVSADAPVAMAGDQGDPGDPGDPGISRDPDVSPSDTVRPADRDSRADPLVGSDWIRGDTITGYFVYERSEEPDTTVVEEVIAADTTETAVDEVSPVADPGAEPEAEAILERLVARGSALSLYRVAQEDADPGAPRRLNFLSGRTIELTFEDGELDVATVDGLHRGIFLDPVAPAPAVSNAQTEEPVG